MLLIILLIFVIVVFNNLCQEYKKTKWFILLGIVAYFAGEFVAGIILGILDGIFLIGIDWEDTTTMALIGLPSGIISIVIVYFILKHYWNKEVLRKQKEVGSIDEITGNNV